MGSLTQHRSNAKVASGPIFSRLPHVYTARPLWSSLGNSWNGVLREEGHWEYRERERMGKQKRWGVCVWWWWGWGDGLEIGDGLGVQWGWGCGRNSVQVLIMIARLPERLLPSDRRVLQFTFQISFPVHSTSKMRLHPLSSTWKNW